MIKKLFYFFKWPIVVFILNIFFAYFWVYDLYSWIDIPMHFLGGFVIAHSFFLIFSYFEKKGFLDVKNKLVFVLLIVSIVSLFAIFWEFWEFLFELASGFDAQLGLEDTMFDLFMGIAGGFVGAVVFNRN